MISIKIKIGNRQYPMKVKSEEEAFIREAAVLLNDAIEEHKENFHTHDFQDLLAMVAFSKTLTCLENKKEMDSHVKQMENRIENIIKTTRK